MYNVIPFTLEGKHKKQEMSSIKPSNFNLILGYLSYVNATRAALLDLQSTYNNQTIFKLIGPAGLFKNPDKHPLCWGLLSQCKESSTCPIDTISFHAKGEENSTKVLEKGIKLVNELYLKYPSTKTMAIANT